ncbi:MAG: MFS transporter [Symploca sp. SIO2B6]|nr:MFS transporter [Symploca sp. SIO2B6]
MGKIISSDQHRVPLWQPLTIRNFLLLFIGENVSLFGDQLYLVALLWLTIQLTNSGLSLGTVLMAAAIPRAILILVGGVISDRTSPRLVMLGSNIVRALLMIILTVIVWEQATQLWHLYLFSICFGILDGFFIPAAQSIVPTLVSKEQLTASNTLTQGTNQLILLIGPVLGGLLIAVSGIKIAFAINAATFIFTAVTLLLMKVCFDSNTATKIKETTTINNSPSQKFFLLITSIREGLDYGWRNLDLRIILLVVMMYNLIFIGPLRIGFASLAHERFPGGAIALGIMNSAWGGGNLLGALMPPLLSNPPKIGVLLLSIAGIQGFGLLMLSFISNITLASVIIVVLGFCSGFFVVTEITWVQKQTPPEMLGRVMSLGVLSSFGIAPFSFALAGLLVDLNLAILFGVTGIFMIFITALLTTNPSVRNIE